jgi:hypothetical protein
MFAQTLQQSRGFGGNFRLLLNWFYRNELFFKNIYIL